MLRVRMYLSYVYSRIKSSACLDDIRGRICVGMHVFLSHEEVSGAGSGRWGAYVHLLLSVKFIIAIATRGIEGNSTDLRHTNDHCQIVLMRRRIGTIKI